MDEHNGVIITLIVCKFSVDLLDLTRRGFSLDAESIGMVIPLEGVSHQQINPTTLLSVPFLFFSRPAPGVGVLMDWDTPGF